MRKVLKVKYRMPGKKFGTKIATGRVPRIPGRKIVSVRKVGREEILRIGEYLPFNPDKLLAEFQSQKEVNKNGKEERGRVTTSSSS